MNRQRWSNVFCLGWVFLIGGTYLFIREISLGGNVFATMPVIYALVSMTGLAMIASGWKVLNRLKKSEK